MGRPWLTQLVKNKDELGLSVVAPEGFSPSSLADESTSTVGRFGVGVVWCPRRDVCCTREPLEIPRAGKLGMLAALFKVGAGGGLGI